MKNLNKNQMRGVQGGNCFLLGIFSLTTPGMMFNIIDHLGNGESYIMDCWNNY